MTQSVRRHHPTRRDHRHSPRQHRRLLLGRRRPRFPLPVGAVLLLSQEGISLYSRRPLQTWALKRLFTGRQATQVHTDARISAISEMRTSLSYFLPRTHANFSSLQSPVFASSNPLPGRARCSSVLLRLVVRRSEAYESSSRFEQRPNHSPSPSPSSPPSSYSPCTLRPVTSKTRLPSGPPSPSSTSSASL